MEKNKKNKIKKGAKKGRKPTAAKTKNKKLPHCSKIQLLLLHIFLFGTSK